MAATTAVILYRGAGAGQVTGTRLLPRYGALSPSGNGVVVPSPEYYPWPQGGERALHSSLGSKRRAKLSKALHEAIEREEPEEKKPPRKKKVKSLPPRETLPAIAPETRAIGAAPEPPIDREPEPPPPLEEEQRPKKKRARAPEIVRIAGHGLLRGSAHAATYGILHAASGAKGRLRRPRRRAVEYGRLEPKGIENPDMDQIYQLYQTYLTANAA